MKPSTAGCQVTKYLILKVYKTGCNNFFKGLNFLLANEFLKIILFLILRKFIFQNKRVINTQGKSNLMEALFLQAFHKQKICNNRLTRKIRLSILHSFIVVYTNHCSFFFETFQAQLFYFKYCDFMFLSCHVRVSERIHTLQLPECQGTPWSKQA